MASTKPRAASRPSTKPPKKDPRVDEYIGDCAPFAQPVLRQIRKLVHQACPDATETLKWGMPSFLYQEKILCGMAGFKAHCSLWFWQGSGVVGGAVKEGAMGSFGRITSLKDLPSATEMKGYVKKAMKLAEAESKGGKVERPRKHAPPPTKPPADLMKALRASAKALKTFEAFTPGKKRDYIRWITEAKTEATRERRLEQAIDWMSEGKPMGWQYMDQYKKK